MKRAALLIIVAVIALAALNGCGQKGDLIKPPKRTSSSYVD